MNQTSPKRVINYLYHIKNEIDNRNTADFIQLRNKIMVINIF